MGPEPALRLATIADADTIDELKNHGFAVVERVQIPMPDGTSIAGASMTKPID